MISIYKPNKNSNGCAANFYISKNGGLFVNMIQQYSWDSNKKTGSFVENKDNAEKTVSIKLNIFEAGEIINAILRRVEWKAFHSFADSSTQIQLTIWEGKGFGLSVSRGGNSFRLPISYGEAEAIKILMEEFIRSQCKNQKPKIKK